MHFGNIVKNYNHSLGLSAEDLSAMLGRTVSEILHLFEKRFWNMEHIEAVSVAYNHNFMHYLENSQRYQNPGL
ncbi:MAG: hypothetical protein ABI390_00790 [Daejeonella sp.]